jgi:hypothetical protein
MQPLPPFKTGIKVGRLPVKTIMLGSKFSGSLVGAGFTANGVPKSGNQHQVWRMDYHGIHTKSPKDIYLIPDGKFHYHIRDPYET